MFYEQLQVGNLSAKLSTDKRMAGKHMLTAAQFYTGASISALKVTLNPNAPHRPNQAQWMNEVTEWVASGYEQNFSKNMAHMKFSAHPCASLLSW